MRQAGAWPRPGGGSVGRSNERRTSSTGRDDKILTGGVHVSRIPTVLSGLLVLLAGNAWGAGTTVSVLSSDAHEIILEVVTDSLDVGDVAMNGRTYQDVRIPGRGRTTEAGRPSLPLAGAMVGIPFGCEAIAEAQVLETRDLGELRIPPAPRYRRVEDPEGFSVPVPDYEEDPVGYGSDAWLPGRAAEVVSVATLRFQRAALLRFYPVSYRPSDGRTLLRSRIRVRLILRSPKEPPVGGTPAPEEEAWEALYDRTLANSAAARAWRRSPSPGVRIPPSGKDGEEVRFRVRIDSTGVYEVTGQELIDAGLVEDVGVGSVALYQAGYDSGAADPFAVRPVPVEVRDLDGNGRLDSDDRLVFFARSFREQWMQEDWEDRFTDLNVYWLGFGGFPGVGMDTVAMGAAGAPAETLSWTWRRSWFEEEHIFDYTPSRLDKDRTHWTHPNRRDVEVSFRLEHVSGSEPGSLRVHFEDAWAGDGISTVSVALHPPAGGAADLGSFTVPDHGPVTAVLEVGAGLLGAGEHRLVFSGYRQAGAEQVPGLGSSLDWVEAVFPCSLRADAGRIDLRIPPHDDRFCLSVSGFRSPGVSLFDVSDPEIPRRVALPAENVQAEGTGWRVVIRDPASTGPRRWLALDEDGFRSLGEDALERVEGVSPAAREADYLILCPEAFLDEAARLAAWREACGYAAEVVPIQDVYDEFGGGFKSTDAIRRYVQYAFERWERKPQFLVLAGDASEDHKRVFEDSDPDWIPTVNVRDWATFRAASDNVYGCVDGDNLPDLLVGRLPAGSAMELGRQIDKILAYETEDEVSSWRQRVVLVADDSYSTIGFGPYTRLSAEVGFEETLRRAGETVANSPVCRADTSAYYLSSYTGRTDSEGYHVNCLRTDDRLRCVRDSVYSAVTIPLVEDLIEGCLIFGYLGHGFRKGMAHELVLAEGVIAPVQGVNRWRYDIEELMEPTGRPFFCAGFGCLLANFHAPLEAVEGDVLLEKFLNREDGGAIACLGSSTSEVLHVENGYADAFFSSMFLDSPQEPGAGAAVWTSGELAVGAAVRFLADVGDAGAVQRRILLGDPALRLRSRPLGFEVWVNGAPLGPGEAVVVRDDSTTARIRAFVPGFLVAGPESLWVEVRDEMGILRLVQGADYTVTPDTSSGEPRYAVAFDHAVRFADYRIVLGAETRDGGTLEDIVRVALDVWVMLDGTPVSDGVPARTGGAGVVDLVLPWSLDAGSLALVLSGADRDIPLEIVAVAENPGRSSQWSLEFHVPDVPAGAYDLVLLAGGERLRLLRLVVHSRLSIDDVIVYPNPLSDEADFLFQLSAEADVRVDIFTVAGHRVRTLSSRGNPGYNTLTWDGRDQEGDRMANGTYLYIVRAGRGGERVESPVGRLALIR